MLTKPMLEQKTWVSEFFCDFHYRRHHLLPKIVNLSVDVLHELILLYCMHVRVFCFGYILLGNCMFLFSCIQGVSCRLSDRRWVSKSATEKKCKPATGVLSVVMWNIGMLCKVSCIPWINVIYYSTKKLKSHSSSIIRVPAKLQHYEIRLIANK